MNVYFGIEDYWKFNILKDISGDLKKKKILVKKEQLYQHNNKEKIHKLNLKSLDKLEELKQE